ncbi:MAG: Hsp20/alpha crystallin family protein [Planctomycetes bacterium]|nr:Hsp20/alpha crystallin family protein [Planctomycetota bacterium]
MAKPPARDEFDQLAGQIGQVIGNLWQWHTGEFCPVDSWSPAVNLYQFEHHFEVCVDLAGVDRKHIEVRVEPGMLIIRGVRESPEPRQPQDGTMRILAMEIDHGTFCRSIELPELIDLPHVKSEYINGLLWIRLPLRKQG